MLKPYNDEYRISETQRTDIPDYLTALFDQMHERLSADKAFNIEAVIHQDPHTYSILIHPDHLTVSNSLNGFTDTTNVQSDGFSLSGGIGDLLSAMVQSGGLPITISPSEVTITESLAQ